MRKKTLLYLLIILIISIFISGCAQNNNAKYIYGNATIESIELQKLKSFPSEINVFVSGYLPDACTEFDEIETKQENNIFYITIKTIKPVDEVCENQPYFFNKNIPLNTKELSPGEYTVIVNGMNGSFNTTANSNSSK